MDYYKRFMISLSPYAEIYAELILENCLHNNKEYGNSLDIVFNDSELTNILYNLIIYGRLVSRTNKSYSTHSRLNSLDDDSKHFTALEIENYQRMLFYLDKVLFVSISISVLSLIIYIVFY